MWKKVLIISIIAIAVLIAGFAGYVQTNYDKNYSEDYPLKDIRVEADSAMIARGKYLAMGPAHCSHCHAPLDQMDEVEAGKEVPLIGGFDLDIPPGTFHAPNITPDPETGIGNLSDGEIYRMLRHNINHRGEACVDFMPFVNMAEEDVYAIIAYLRSLEPVKHEKPARELSFLGKAVFALGGVKPGVPDKPVPQRVKKEVSAQYGQYLAYAVANCRGCHTNRDMTTGEYIGEWYAGGFQMGPDNTTKGYTFITPNLTPDPETGVIYDWDEDTFVKRMKQGRVHKMSPMPWGAFSQMDEGDIRSIYRFLQSLEPVKNEVPLTVIEPEEEV